MYVVGRNLGKPPPAKGMIQHGECNSELIGQHTVCDINFLQKSAGERGIRSGRTGQISFAVRASTNHLKVSYLCDPKLLAFLRQLAASMPGMVVQVTGFISHQFHCKLGRTAAALFEGMACFELCSFGRWWCFVPCSLDTFVFCFCVNCENRSDLKEYS